jgi:pimeloyl-ACP methyl ester carboxylesterase
MGAIRGLKALIHDAVDLTVDLVEEGHESAARGAMRILEAIEPLRGPARLVDAVRRTSTAGVLGTVRVVNRGVAGLLDVGADSALVAPTLAALEERVASPVPMRSDVLGTRAWWLDASLAALNGAVGDYLHREGNHLDLGMTLRHGDRFLALEPAEVAALAAPKLAVLVHGLGASEWSWCLDAALHHGAPDVNLGTLLERERGYRPFYARYNSGRHVSHNGKLLAERLERLVACLPPPVDDIVLVGHSMGGLVVRSACHYAATAGHAWVARVSRVFCLGSPHRGAPAEKLGNVVGALLGAIDHPGTRIPAELIRRRSSGIKDLRYGFVVDEDWLGRDPDSLVVKTPTAIPLLDGVAYHFVTATVTRDPAHPVGQLMGDMLVRVESASGPEIDAKSFLIETECHGGVWHHQLQNHPAVCAQICRACDARSDQG